MALEVVGAAPGARFVLRGPGLADTTVVAASDSVLTRSVTLPKATTTAAYVLVGSDGQVGVEARVLGKRTLNVSTLASDGPRTRVLVRRLAARNKQVRDLGVKQAPFVVLIGAAMPSVLAEISFVTNRQEGQLLKTGAYRQQIAEALFDAVVRYQQSLKKWKTGTVGVGAR